MAGATNSDVKNRLSAYLRRVRAGETVVIMDRKTPIAVLAPIGGPEAADVRLEKLLAAGTLVRESGAAAGGIAEGTLETGKKAVTDDARIAAPVSLKEPVDLMEVLLAERRQGR
jgi:prevent-host-death family protein